MTGPVERVTLTHLEIPLKEPFSIEGSEVAVRAAILVTVESEVGTGVGESAPVANGHGSVRRAVDCCWNALADEIVPRLLGRSFASCDEIGGMAADWAGTSYAKAGAEAACWDLLGQARHATVAELLGASSEQLEMGVESGLTVGLYPTVVALLKAIEVHLEEGYRRVKIAIRPGRDIELVRAVRQHFGDLPLMVDAGAAYTVDQLEVFRELDDYDLLMFEQPMAAADLDGMAQLQSAVATPVCLDESACTLELAAEAIRLGACRIVSLQLQRVGGFGPARALHDLCYHHGVACWVGSTPELGIGQVEGLHLAALANCRYPTDIEPSTRWFVDDYIVPRLEMAAPGVLSVPSRAGLGYLVDPVKVRRYSVRHEEFTARSVG